ncbi:MAG TPA: prepilin-type N-terminal cleavage/methylation domain-containing protein [Fimbriimonadaceae bacterium]|nr:prepilin-type N-terminal cleavage/methylation domain-containing protein [Fimbriimonadaceae bacterium]
MAADPIDIRSSRFGAFTLIELLVVIAIIAILAAILFPVFAQVKQAAKKTACLSNSKQLSLGVLMYSGDWDEVLPPTQDAALVLWPNLIRPYTKNAQIRICPSDAEATNSYGLNELIFVDITDYLPNPPPFLPTETSLQTPSETIMLGELGSGDDLKTPRENAYKLTAPDGDLNDPYDARPAARHFDQANLAFFDGHSKAMKLSQFYMHQTPVDKWFCRDPSDPNSCRDD